MKFGLLTNAENDRASPWDAVGVILQVAARITHLIMDRMAGDGISKPFGRSRADEAVPFSLRLIYLRKLPRLPQRIARGERNMVADIK